MGSYVNAALMPGETVVYSGKSSIKAYWMSILLGSLLALLMIPLIAAGGATGTKIVFFLFAAWLLAVPFLVRHTTELAITNKKIIAKFGLISRRTVEINLAKTESIQVNQGIFGRILNYGTLVISGAGNPQAPIPRIDDPMSFRRAYLETVEKLEHGSRSVA